MSQNTKNIILIGMPGAGKSTIGVLLAKSINYDFLDSDIIIQNRYDKKLFEIINENGIDEFLNIENHVLSEIDVKKTVVATGGSAVYGDLAMTNLKENGIVVYLKLSLHEIERRINNIKTRGIAMKNGENLADIYKKRVPLYEKYADIIIDAENTTIEECVRNVINVIITR